MKKVVFLILVFSNTVFAQKEIVTDRPDVTESALTIPVKSAQLETGFTYLNQQHIKSFTLPEYLIRIGIFKFLELRAENSFFRVDNKISNSDLFLGIKAQIIRKKRLNVAFLSHINLPEQNREDLLFIEKLLVSYAINEKSEIAFNIGIVDLNKDSNGQFVYSIAYGRGLTDKLGFYIENFGSIQQSEINSFVDGGFAYLLKSKIQLDVKVGIDTQFFKNYFVGFGISIRAFN